MVNVPNVVELVQVTIFHNASLWAKDTKAGNYGSLLHAYTDNFIGPIYSIGRENNETPAAIHQTFLKKKLQRLEINKQLQMNISIALIFLKQKTTYILFI